MKIFERRGAPRMAVTVAVEQHVEGQTHRCLASNLSTSGVFIERPLSSFVRHSADVEVEIPIPDGGEPLWASAEIVYDCFNALFHGSALRFKSMSPRDRARLSAFLSPVMAEVG